MVIWSNQSKKNLKEIYGYIKEDSIFYAKKVIETIVNKSAVLEKFPRMGRIVPELGEENIREIIIYSYRLIYKISTNDIEVLSVIHGMREFPDEFN